VGELKAQGQDKGEDALDKRLAIVQQTQGGRFILEIHSDGAVVPRLVGGIAPGSPFGQMVDIVMTQDERKAA
jgi:hypothetical protein